MSIISRFKKPLLALALVSGLGMGVSEAMAYDYCDPCVRKVVVRRVKRVRCNPCYTPVRRVYRVVEPVVYVERPVYYESAPTYVETLPPPAPCTSCR